LEKYWRVTIFALTFILLVALVSGCGARGTQQGGAGKGAVPQKWVFATDHEFSVRPDGLPALQETYGLKFDEVKTMDLGVTYGA